MSFGKDECRHLFPRTPFHILTSIEHQKEGRAFFALPYPTYNWVLGTLSDVLSTPSESVYKASFFFMPLLFLTSCLLLLGGLRLQGNHAVGALLAAALVPDYVYAVANQYSALCFLILVSGVLLLAEMDIRKKSAVFWIVVVPSTFILLFGYLFLHRASLLYLPVLALTGTLFLRVSGGWKLNRKAVWFFAAFVGAFSLYFAANKLVAYLDSPSDLYVPSAQLGSMRHSSVFSRAFFWSNLTGYAFQNYLALSSVLILLIPSAMRVLRSYPNLQRFWLATLGYTFIAFFHEGGNRAFMVLNVPTFFLIGASISDAVNSNAPRWMYRTAASVFLFLSLALLLGNTFRLKYAVNVPIPYQKRHILPQPAAGGFYNFDPWLIQPFMESQRITNVRVGGTQTLQTGDIIVVLDGTATYFGTVHPYLELLHRWLKDFPWWIQFLSLDKPDESLATCRRSGLSICRKLSLVYVQKQRGRYTRSIFIEFYRRLARKWPSQYSNGKPALDRPKGSQ